MKRLTSLWRELALECASWCGTSAIRDIKTVTDRVEAEGESFLTITLPQFAKDFERSLELGSVVPYPAFSGFTQKGGFPLFLRGFLGQIFDTSGTLLAEPSIDCILSVRQLTLVFGKIFRPCSDARVRSAMRKFVELEAELEEFDYSSLEEFLPQFRKASTLLWADVFSHVENSLLDRHQLQQHWISSSEGLTSNPIRVGSSVTHGIRHGGDRATDVTLSLLKANTNVVASSPMGIGTTRENHWLRIADELVDPTSRFSLVPSHGPGHTADRLAGNSKFDLPTWPRRLERVFPYGDYALPNWRHYDQLDRVQFLDPGSEVPVKVTPVPKTDKTPRIIALEPTAVQYMQQALLHQFVNCLEEEPELSPPFGGKACDLGKWYVGFHHQEPNRLLARKGSLDGSLATLDLSDASDRVLNEHVLLLFSGFPHLSEAVQATRSTKAHVPGEGVISLSKFSSMGSALCFPVEAMVFTTLVFMGIAKQRRVPLDRELLFEMRGQVRVYGDDIVVPVDCVQEVIRMLELFGLKVNGDKSFWNGKFRESCGGDYYDGEWVTPIRLRHELPRSLRDVEEVVGLVSFRNLLYWGGYWKTARYLDGVIKPLLRGRWPIVATTAAGLGRESCLPYQVDFLDSKLHDPRVHGAIVRSTIPRSQASGTGALLKFFLKRGILPSQDEKHLERQGRPQSSRIILRGIRPY